MNPINDIAMWLQLAMLIANICILIANLVKAAQKPTQVQNQRLDSLEKWRDRVDERLDQGNAHFCEIDAGTKITQESLLALMAHALNGNDIEKLKKAKDKLEQYLIEK